MTPLLALTAAVSAFNLTCTGTMHSFSRATGSVSKPYTAIYRIDLTRKIWCEGDCKGTAPIARVLPTSLFLRDEDGNSASDTQTDADWIDRETGEHHSLLETSLSGMTVRIRMEGHCERSAFTGFPKFKTKF